LAQGVNVRGVSGNNVRQGAGPLLYQLGAAFDSQNFSALLDQGLGHGGTEAAQSNHKDWGIVINILVSQ